MEKSIFEHLADLQASKERIDEMMDLSLAHYKTKAKQLTPLLKRLTVARNKLELLEQEFKDQI